MIIGPHDIEHRDALDTLAAMREAGGARLIVTSPPYPDARTDEQYGCASFDTTLAGYGRLGEACFEALVPGGVVALNIDGPIRVWRPELGESERSLIAFEVAIDWARRIGFRYVEHCAFMREGVPGSHGPRWRAGWEPVHLLARPGGAVKFDPMAYTRPSSNAGKFKSHKGARSLGGVQPTRGFVVPERRKLRTAERWPVGSSVVDPDHPAPFPAAFADAFVLCYSAAGDVVCDPFVGSGTVAFSCHRHGRRFVGGDLGHRERDGRRWADIVADALRQRDMFEVGT